MATSKIRKQRRGAKVVEAMLKANHEMQLMLMDQVSLIYDSDNPPAGMESEAGKYQKIFSPLGQSQMAGYLYLSVFKSPFSEVTFQVATLANDAYLSSYSQRVLAYNWKATTWSSQNLTDPMALTNLNLALLRHKHLSQSFFSMDFQELSDNININLPMMAYFFLGGDNEQSA